MSVLAAMGFSFRFFCRGHGFEVGVEAVETFLPERPVLFHPIGDVFEFFAIELAGAPLRFARLGDEAGLFQDLEVLGDGREAHFLEEGPGEVGDVGFALRQSRQDGAAGGVGECGEGLTELILHN